ncbi:hypothetical protein SMNI109538_04330 [Smaragdicoccus niigatensis]
MGFTLITMTLPNAAPIAHPHEEAGNDKPQHDSTPAH